MNIRRLLLNLFILFVAIFLAIFIAEFLFRAFYNAPDKDNWVGPSMRYYKYDPLLGWSKIPNTKTTRISEGGNISVLYEINSKGIRGPEYPYNKANNVYRILMLGDSFTEGYMVGFDDLFSEVMSRELNNMYKNIYFQAINTGTSAWSTDQELLFFQNEGKKYKPDLTILMFYQNDLEFNNQPKDWSMYYKPLFKKKAGKLVLTNVPVPTPDKIVISDQLNPAEKSTFKQIRDWLYKKSYLYAFVKERIKKAYFSNNLTTRLHLIEKSNNKYAGSYELWRKMHSKSVDESWQITEALIIKLKEETDSIGSNLIVFFIPDEANVDLEIWKTIKEQYEYSDDDFDLDQVGIELEAICKRNGIDFFNSKNLFINRARELKKDNKSLYNSIDRHWNIEGNKLVGEVLKDLVAAKYLENRMQNIQR